MYMREKKKLISIDIDSALALMQEIYNDIVEQRNSASIIMKKMLSFMKESEDMSVIGPVIKEQQKILNDCIEKKISLVKLQNLLLKQSAGDAPNKKGFSKMSLSDDDIKLLEKFAANISDDDDKEKDENYSL